MGAAAPPRAQPWEGPVRLVGIGRPTEVLNRRINERARWLWLTAHRLSDERRLERQYARPDSMVFPHGPYFKNGLTYGTAVNLPIPNDELNNPKFTACLDRLP